LLLRFTYAQQRTRHRSSSDKDSRVKWIAIGFKIGVSGLLAWLVLKHVDFAAAGALLRS